MNKKDSKCEIKTKLKKFLNHSYVNVFLVFAMVLVMGVLLNAFAYAQDQPMGFPGGMDLSSPDGSMPGGSSNQPPSITSLEPDKPSPQEAGTSIKWTVKAEDPENDPISYMFRLKGPAVGDEWLPATQWIQDNTWTWNTASLAVGTYQISVWVRDPMHTNPDFKPNEKIVNYQITTPHAPAVAAPPVPGAEQNFVPPPSVPEQQPVQVPEQVAPPVINQPPSVGSLTADQPSPQVAGATVTFTASASDPENDPLQYIFLLDGQPRTDFTGNPSWTWTTSVADIGSHSIEVRVRDNNHNPEGDSSQAVNFVIVAPPNNPPTVTDLAADQPSPQAAGATVTFTATASDPENDPLQYMFLLDGQPRTDFTENPSWTWTTSAADIGPHSIEARARDNNHNPEGDSSKAIDFAIEAPPNNPPTVTDLAADQPSPQAAGATVTFTASASDPENDPLQYMFLLDGQPRTDFTENPSWTWTTSAADIGPHSIEARARDNNHNPEGDSSKAIDFAIEAPPNNPPTVTDLTADQPSPQVAGATVTFTASASDPENDPLQYMFLLDGQPRTDFTENPSWTWTTSAADIGQHSIEVRARDNNHNPEGDSSKAIDFVIEAPPNNPPTVTDLTADQPSPQVAGATVTFTATASDPENDPLQYMFLLDGQPRTDFTENPSWTWTTSAADIGQHSIEVRARDNNHNPEGDSSKAIDFVIEAPPNNPPTVTDLTADQPSPQVAGATVTFTASASDPENDPLQYMFLLDGQPRTDFTENPSWTWTTSAADIGPHSIEVRVRDNNHNPDGDSSKAIDFVIEAPPNNPPTVTDLTADQPSPQLLGTVVTWTADASDPENDPISYRFLVNNTPASDWQPQNQFAWTATKPGTSTIMVQVRDNQHEVPQGENGNKSAEFTIIVPAPVVNETVPAEVVPVKLNESPSITGLTADKESPQLLGTTVNWTVDASDPENDPISYRFLVNDTPASDWQPQNQFAWTATEPGTSTIMVQVRDNQHEAPQGENGNKSAEFTINAPAPEVAPAVNETVPAEVVPVKLNESPSITGLTADKESPQLLGTTVNWTVDASDPENDPISYRFLVNDTPASDWQPQNQFAWTATEPGTSTIMVQVRDNQHEAPQGENGNKSAEFTINAPAPEVAPAVNETVPAEVVPVKLNESPSITGLTADKESPQLLGTTVNWTVDASDPENDPISYRFLVNDTPASDWQPQNQFAWTATEPGTSTIMVQVRDNQHEAPQGENGNKSAEFTINAPAPEVAPAVNETVPAEVVPVKLNESPSITGLTADKESPQLLGTTVNWTVDASDPENDPISYRFLVNDTPASDWQPQNQFAWTATEPGTSTITAQVRDNQHEGPQGENGNKSAEFTITALIVIAPETVTPPAEENITTPVAPENVTEIPAPVNETVTAPAVENQTPILNSLIPDIASPQRPGVTVTWTANATDADMDTLLFRFFLNGPATNGAWQPETDWSTADTWTWVTSAADTGENQVRAQVRDGKHAAEDSFDSELSSYYTLSQPTMNITGTAYDDKNGNGKTDSGEALAGWTIQIVKPDNSQVSVITKDDGSYRFEQLNAGSYTVSETLPSGWVAITPESGSYNVDLTDSDATGLDFANKLTLYVISGMKYNDLDGNGANDGEPGMEGWTVQLSKDGSVVNTATTGADGTFRFGDLTPGSYTVAEVEQSGWTRTAPPDGSYSVELADSDATGKDFGNHGSFAISGTSFLDSNGNGVKDSDETGQAGMSIQLSQNGNVINATTTAQDGSYSFHNLAPGTYTISEVAQEGMTQTVPEGSYTVDLKDADVTGKDFGSRGDLSISGQKYYDINGNGVQDADEPGIPGGAVSLVENGKVVANTTTDDNGMYSFQNVLPGTYTINDPVPGGLILTTSSTITVTVTTTVVVKANFGLVGPYSISGLKYNDLNSDGSRNSGEPVVSGWDMVLTGTTWFGKPLPPRTTTTAADGTYKFDKLLPGTYKVSETSRTGWTQTAPPDGSYTIPFPFGAPPQESKNNNFGNRVEAQSISGVKYNDINGNGVRNPGEPGLEGWTINLEQPAGTIIQTKTTAADGSYSFTGLALGTYVISEVQQPDWTQKAPAGGKYTVTLGATTTSAAGKDFGNWNPLPTNPTLISDKSSPQKAGTPIIWTAGATDADPLQFRFFVRGPGQNQDTGYSSNSVWTWDTSGKAAGTYQVEVWIRDGKHAGTNSFDVKKTVSFTLTSANRPPRVQVLYSDRPAPQYAGSWIKWTALASDPDGDSLQYKFYLRGPSTRGFWMDQTGWSKNNRWIWRTNPGDVGYSQVLVAVRDGKHAGPGGSDDYEVDSYFIINANLPPVITSLGTNLQNPQPIGATIRWSATANDPEGNAVFYRYWLKGPSTGGFWRLVRDWSTDPTWTWPTTPADAGTSEVQVQVRDGLHAGPSGWDDDAGGLFTVLRPNLPPTLVSLMPDKPSSQTAGTPIKWTATATDPDRDHLLYRFWLKGPSTGNNWEIVQDWSTRNQWIWSSLPNDGGAYTVYVYVRDGLHNPATGYDSAMGAPYILISNQPPILTALKADRPSPQSAGTVVKWTATAVDANKDPISYRFWLKGPSTGNVWRIVRDWSLSNQWIWANAPTDAGNYKVFVYARDGLHSPLTGYDSAVGQDYTLLDLVSRRVLPLGKG